MLNVKECTIYEQCDKINFKHFSAYPSSRRPHETEITMVLSNKAPTEISSIVLTHHQSHECYL